MKILLRCAASGFGLAVLFAPAASFATPAGPPHVIVHARTIAAKGPLPQEQAIDLYSVHARRLVRSYLRLRLAELRALQLERVRAVIEGKLGVDTLLSPAGPEEASGQAHTR